MEIQGIKNGDTRDIEWRYQGYDRRTTVPFKIISEQHLKRDIVIFNLEKSYILTFS